MDSRYTPPDSDEDIFDSSGTGENISSLPRLEQQHTTEGYRDGITASKPLHIQTGFDEGYIIGGILGLKIGWMLGALDGLWNVTKSSELLEMKTRAKKELAMTEVYGKEYFGSDGVWEWAHPAGEEGEDLGFEEIARYHPLVVKWMGLITETSNKMELELMPNQNPKLDEAEQVQAALPNLQA